MRIAQIFAALLLIVGFEMPAYAAPGGKATVKIPNAVFDFGVVSQGAKVEHDFSVQNTGAGELRIDKVIPSCGCTVGKVDPDVIAPGASGNIHVAFDTTGFSGSKVKTIRLYTNDPDNDTVLLTLKGVIEPDTRIDPKQIYILDAIKDGNTIVAGHETLIVEAREGSNISIGDVRTYSKYISVKEVSGTNTRKELKVELLPTTPVGEVRDKIIVSIEGGKRKAINVPVYAAVSGPVTASQSVVSFGVISGSEILKRSIKITNRGTTPVSIEDVVSSNPAVSTSVVEVQPGKVFVLHLNLDPAGIKDELRGTVKVLTSDATSKSIPVSVVGIVPKEISSDNAG